MQSLIAADVDKMMSANGKKSNLDVLIEYYVSEEGSVVLTAKQEELRVRIDQANDLLRDGKFSTREVARLLTKKFGIALSTAFKDIEGCRYVFGKTKKPGKYYNLNAHIEEISETIIWAKRNGREDLLPKLYNARTLALDRLPDDGKEVPAPAAIILNITQTNNTFLPPDFSPEDAQEAAKARLKERGVDDTPYAEILE